MKESWREAPDNPRAKAFLIPQNGDEIGSQGIPRSHGEGRTGFEFVFPRVVDGQPVIRPGDQSFALEFGHPPVGIFPGRKVRHSITDR